MHDNGDGEDGCDFCGGDDAVREELTLSRDLKCFFVQRCLRFVARSNDNDGKGNFNVNVFLKKAFEQNRHKNMYGNKYFDRHIFSSNIGYFLKRKYFKFSL